MGHILLDLKDKTAVVIGGTSGIGLALAKELAEAGANVVPTGRRAEQVRTAAAALEEFGRRSLAVTCDVTDDASLEQLLEQVVSKFGSVEILVNCAGRTKRAPTLEFADTDWGRAQPCAGQTRDKHAKSPSDSFRVSYFTMLSEAIRATFLGVAEADKSTRAPASSFKALCRVEVRRVGWVLWHLGESCCRPCFRFNRLFGRQNDSFGISGVVRR